MNDSDKNVDFIREIVEEDLAAGRHRRIVTRFPPEPNGYLHIGHAKSICLNFGAAEENGGRCHLRFDDTNPSTEDIEYVESIQRDVRWLGFDWGEHLYYASDYYERLYMLGEKLIELGRAYVCDLTEDEFANDYRGTITEHGKDSPYRARSKDENLDLFRRMRAGEFADGAKVLRARIDMTSPNMKMRDPPLYRIKHAHHYRTGDAWCLYPLYDFAHCLSDSFEGITHSLCTMEFESARELYDWVVAATEVPHVPRQTEFARLNLSYTVMSKRKLLKLVKDGVVAGWDDPRMPTISGMRRRGYTPEAIRAFCKRIGVAKNLSTVDLALLEHTVRDDLNERAPRVLAVLRPLKVVVESWRDGEVDVLDAPYWPHDVPKEGTRPLPFTRELFIDRDDFAEEPPKGFKRLAPGREVRLRHAYVVRCTQVIKDAQGEIVELRCTHDASSRGGAPADGRKIDGTIQWVSATHATPLEVRLYDRLFTTESPGEGDRDFMEDLNPAALTSVSALGEASLANARHGEHYQLERTGFFVVDPDTTEGRIVLNRTVALKDAWARAQASSAGASPKVDAAARPKAQKTPAQAPRVVEELAPRARAWVDTHAIAEDDARTLAAHEALARVFDEALAASADARAVAGLLVNEILGELRSRDTDAPPFGGAEVAELVVLAGDGTLSRSQVKDVLGHMFAGEGAPRAIVEARGLRQIASEDALAPVVDRVLADNADAVARLRGGNANVLGALVGMVMKATGGKANAKVVRELVQARVAG